MAVLFRAAYHSQELEFELTKRDIPYDYRGGVRFFERSHIKDACAFLKVINNLKDEVAWLRVLNLQTGIGEVTAGKIYQRLKDLKTMAQVSRLDISDILTPKSAIGWRGLAGIFDDLKSVIDDQSVSELIRAVAKSDYQNYLESQFPNWQERLEDLEQLAKFAENYMSLNAFLSEISLQEGFGADRGQAGRADEAKLVLTTIHQAKGLEWEVVFVINLIDAAFPNQRALSEDGGLEEERRLFYVAITRAKQQLFFSYPVTGSHASMYLNTPSQFLGEIPAELMEKVKLIDDSRWIKNEDLDDGEVQYLPEV
ncbi:MAG: UvrD/REP helicase [Parcubacteria group bacterium GW2011_GWC2_45_15]|nr:MAG: UvrD/REP helicase [Parcubacteria group bacterium GW2011_GWC2_45_15]